MPYYQHKFNQGEDYFVDIDLRDEVTGALIDTTGWTGSSEIKTLDGATVPDSLGSAIAFTVTFPSTGTVRLSLPRTKTSQMPAKRLLYGCRLIDAGDIANYYLNGDVIVERVP